MPRLLIDANIFLELELSQSKSADCKAFLSDVQKGRIKATTTDFILDSVAVVMESHSLPASDIGRFFSSLIMYKGLLIHNLDLNGRVMAAEAMNASGIDFDDATSIATMMRLGIKKVVSFDRDFDKVRKISRIEPKEALAPHF
ncbi:MAG TPA: type II toxin-antitoxin system VapC family toxin [Nitrososphaerales archaeon]|nr:type II toxin-antitoxin system VapC family toxin [Nitrososphaerales archaeon]